MKSLLRTVMHRRQLPFSLSPPHRLGTGLYRSVTVTAPSLLTDRSHVRVEAVELRASVTVNASR